MLLVLTKSPMVDMLLVDVILRSRKDDFRIQLVVNAYADVETKLMTSHKSRRFFTTASACCFLTVTAFVFLFPACLASRTSIVGTVGGRLFERSAHCILGLIHIL
jgi:hypothetical protein